MVKKWLNQEDKYLIESFFACNDPHEAAIFTVRVEILEREDQILSHDRE